MIAGLFELDPTARAVLILQCAMPVAVYCYLYAQHGNRAPDEVAGLVSTAAAGVTIPTILGILS